jgi:hypothetical protein
MTKEISINFIWVNRNTEWQIPEDWDPHWNEDSVSENLNEVTEDWHDNEDLELTLTESITPPKFLSNPEFDTTFLSEMFNESARSDKTLELLPSKWIEFGEMLRSMNINPGVIAVPNGVTPWEWYALTEDERLGQMGLAESDSLRSDGVLQSDLNSFYFDVYRFGSVSFQLTEPMEIEELVTNPQFIAYSQEIIDRGPGFLAHKTCDENCDFQPCSQMEVFPASISN